MVSVEAEAPPPGPEPHPERPVRDPLRLVSRTLGELLVTAGVLLLLFVVYQLVWTNVQADLEASRQTDQLEQEWQRDSAGPEFDKPLARGKAFAILHVPRLGADWQSPVVQGVSLDDLAKGVGHYPRSALPGRVGNFAVAGHRATNGEPFAALDRLRAGDVVVVESRTTWYTYEVDDGYIVPPTQVEVVAPVPNQPEAEPTEALITLTTCNPRWASYERLIFHGRLVEERPKSDGPPAALRG
jgi:sortase A